MYNRKTKKCSNPNCDYTFVQFKTTDKYCSVDCAKLFYKPLKRTPLLKKPYVLKKTPLNKKPSSSKKKFEAQFSKMKLSIVEKVIKETGGIKCEKCFTNKSIQFSTHHIVFRSEKPNHSELNNIKNLIYLCYECHNSFHNDKKSRNYLIKERDLETLFGESIWGYE